MTIVNHEQAEHWNSGDDGTHWVVHQARYDRQLEPFATLLLDAANLEPGEGVLDVGCGCDETTRAAARVVTPGEAVGVDLSRPMLAKARADPSSDALGNAHFVEGDAQVHPFEPDSFDAVISRFGVMFFADTVEAFANLERATKPGGRLAFVCWQALVENEWLLVPGAAVAELLPLPDLGPEGGPGMFALSDPDEIKGTMTEAGWENVEIHPHHLPMLLGGGGSLDETVEFLRTASIGRTLLENAAPDTQEQALELVRAALRPHLDDEGVRLNSAVWLVQAWSPTGY